MRPSLRPRELLGLLPLQMISVTSAALTSRRARAGAKAVQEGLPRLFLLTRNAVAAALGSRRSGLDVLLLSGRRTARTRPTTNHTLRALRQQVHPRILPKTLKIHDRVAGAPSIQQRGMTDHLRDVARPIWTIQGRRHLVLRQGSR